MSNDYADARTALAHALESLDVLTVVYDKVPDSVVVPSAAVVPGDPFVTYHEAMGGAPSSATTRLDFDLIVFAARWETNAGQDVIDELVFAVPDLLEQDPTLAGAVKVTTVAVGTNYGVVTVAGSQYLGCRFAVEVYL